MTTRRVLFVLLVVSLIITACGQEAPSATPTLAPTTTLVPRTLPAGLSEYETVEIECTFFQLAWYFPEFEFSYYGTSTDEWQAEGPLSTHWCGNWVVTTTVPAHRFLSRLLGEEYGSPRTNVIYSGGGWFPQALESTPEREITAVVLTKNAETRQGQLLALLVNGETIYDSARLQDAPVRDLNPLEAWALEHAGYRISYLFDAPACLEDYCPSVPDSTFQVDWQCGLPRSRDMMIEGFYPASNRAPYPPCWGWYPICEEGPTGEYQDQCREYLSTPPDAFARFNILLSVMQEENLFLIDDDLGVLGPDAVGIAINRNALFYYVDATTGELLQPWWFEGQINLEWLQFSRQPMLFEVPESGQVAILTAQRDSCSNPEQPSPESCSAEEIFRREVYPGQALTVSFWGTTSENDNLEVRLEDISPWVWTVWLNQTHEATRGTPLSELAEYLPEEDLTTQ